MQACRARKNARLQGSCLKRRSVYHRVWKYMTFWTGSSPKNDGLSAQKAEIPYLFGKKGDKLSGLSPKIKMYLVIYFYRTHIYFQSRRVHGISSGFLRHVCGISSRFTKQLRFPGNTARHLHREVSRRRPTVPSRS